MRLRLLTLSLGNFAIGTGSLVLAGILPLVADGLHVSLAAAGQLVTVYALSYAVASPLLSFAFGAHSPRKLLLWAIVLFVLSNLLAAFTPSFAVLIIARIIAGASGALFTPTASGIAVNLSQPAERGRALALVFAGLPVATALGVPIGTFLGGSLGWRFTFGVVAFIGALALFSILFKLGQVPMNARPSLKTWSSVFRNGQLLLALTVILLQFAAQFTAFTYSASLLAKVTHLGSTGISMTLLLFGAASIVGNSIGGTLTDRWGASRVLLASILLLGVDFFALSVAATSSVGAALAFAVWGFTGMAFTPAQQARLIGMSPALTGVLLSLNASFMYLGTAAGSALGGIVVTHFSVTAICTTAGLLLAVSLLVFLLSQRRIMVPSVSAVENQQ